MNEIQFNLIIFEIIFIKYLYLKFGSLEIEFYTLKIDPITL